MLSVGHGNLGMDLGKVRTAFMFAEGHDELLTTSDSERLNYQAIELPNSKQISSRESTLLLSLLSEALSLFEKDRTTARQRLECAFALIRAEVSPAVSDRGVLAKWRDRKVKNYIRDNLGSSLRIEDVARTVDLSASYFSRAFKATTGIAYTIYVMRARIALAKQLLLTTDTPISEIAVICGLADQPHLTRIFRQSEGLPPAAWRRRHRDNLPNLVEAQGCYSCDHRVQRTCAIATDVLQDYGYKSMAVGNNKLSA